MMFQSESDTGMIMSLKEFDKFFYIQRPCKSVNGIFYYRLNAFIVYTYQINGDKIVINFINQDSRQRFIEIMNT